MTEQEQIEEMANIPHKCIKSSCEECIKNDRKCADYTRAEAIYNAGYRKADKDSVVLSREEYEKLKQYEEKVENGACFTQKEWLELCDEEYRRETENLLKVRQLERKETAKEILNELIDSSNKITFFDCRMALGLDKLAKQFGVEIKE